MLVPRVDVHLDALGIASGHYAGSRWCANARSDAEVRELAALLRHSVQMRGAMHLRSKWLDVSVTEIVAENDDEIRFPCIKRQTARRKSRNQCHDGPGDQATLPNQSIADHLGLAGYNFNCQAFTEFRSLIKTKLPATRISFGVWLLELQ